MEIRTMCSAKPLAAVGFYLRHKIADTKVFGEQTKDMNMILRAIYLYCDTPNIVDDSAHVGMHYALQRFLQPRLTVFGREYNMCSEVTK
jgi:hypothetical protein